MTATVLSLLLLGQATSAAPAAPLTAQQRFNAASEAALSGKCAEAIPMFEALEASPAVRKSPLVSATIALRKGTCLLRTGGEEAGEALVRAALPTLAAGGADYREDVRSGEMVLSLRALDRLDYPAAIAHGKATLAASVGEERVSPLMSLARLTTFDGGPEPLAYADEALALMRAAPESKGKKEAVAAVQTIRARVLMAQGRTKEAYAELRDSVAKLGGMTMKVTLADVAARSDLAIAALLNGDKESAREYLAYTGAGRMADAPFARAAYMSPPPCGGEAGLKPSDFAVIEFSLLDDGSVANVRPIYTTGGRAVAIEFARAVKQWSWKPADVQAIPAFFRHLTRIELRCTSEVEAPALTAPLWAEAAPWLKQTPDSSLADMLPDAAREMPRVRAELARERAAGNHGAVVARLHWLGNSDLLPEAERIGLLDEAIQIAQQHDAPPAVITRLAISRLNAPGWRDSAVRQRDQGMRALLADPRVQASAVSITTLRLLIAQPRFLKSYPDDAEQLLRAVVSDARLGERHPLKVAALMQQATLLSRRGDLSGARQAFAQTGLTEEQCALLDVKPALRSMGNADSQYPMAAIQMGFEGWVRTEFDIAANGATARQRVIAAYPPFIFNEAATGILKGLRYQASYRPEGGTACSARTESIAFRIPK